MIRARLLSPPPPQRRQQRLGDAEQSEKGRSLDLQPFASMFSTFLGAPPFNFTNFPRTNMEAPRTPL